MTDVTRRTGDVPPVEEHRTTPGVREGTGRTAPAPGAGSPPPAAHPQPGGTTPAGTGTGTGTHHDGDRSSTGTGTGTHHGADRVPTGTGTHHDGDRSSPVRLLRLDDTDKLTARLQHAVAGFVDAPRDAVREADLALQELTERFTEAVTERRRTLRRSWQTDGADGGGAETATDTEQLRLALRDYRELAERLLHA